MENIMEIIINFVNEYLVRFAVNIICAALVLIIGLKIVKLLTKRLSKAKGIQKMDSSAASLILNGIKLLLNALIIIIAVQILGVPSATIIAAIGSCGLAIGLALQGGLSNFAGGVMIMIFKPFHIGDYIVTGSGEGVVEEINLFYTKLATVDNRTVNIPNSALSSTTVTNLSSKETRGIDTEVSLAYGSDLELARKTLISCADGCEYVLKDPAPMVFVSEHGESSVKVTLRVTVEGKNYWPARFYLSEHTLLDVAAAGLKIPFPQVDVHMKTDA